MWEIINNIDIYKDSFILSLFEFRLWLNLLELN